MTNIQSIADKTAAVNDLYATITARLAAGSPFTTGRGAFQGYEPLAEIAGIKIGLSIDSTKQLSLWANTRTERWPSLNVAVRHGRGRYDVSLTREQFDAWTQQFLGGELNDARTAKAIEIIEAGQIERNGTPHTYTVKDKYHVDTVVKTCTCADYKYRGVECKHIKAAQLLEEQAAAKPEPAPANIGHSIQVLLGQEPVTHNPKPRQVTAEERERGYAAALRPDPANRKRDNRWQFKAR